MKRGKSVASEEIWCCLFWVKISGPADVQLLFSGGAGDSNYLSAKIAAELTSQFPLQSMETTIIFGIIHPISLRHLFQTTSAGGTGCGLRHSYLINFLQLKIGDST